MYRPPPVDPPPATGPAGVGLTQIAGEALRLTDEAGRCATRQVMSAKCSLCLRPVNRTREIQFPGAGDSGCAHHTGFAHGFAFDNLGNRLYHGWGGDTAGNDLRTTSYGDGTAGGSANNLNQYTAITSPGTIPITGHVAPA